VTSAPPTDSVSLQQDASSGPSGLLRAVLLAFAPLLLAVLATMLAARADGVDFAAVQLFPSRPLPTLRFALAVVALLASYFSLFCVPGLLLMRTLAMRFPNAMANALSAFVLSLLVLSLGWIAAQALTDGLAGRTCLYLTVASTDLAILVAGVALAAGAPAILPLPRAQQGTGRAELLVPVAGVILLCVFAWALMPGKISIEALEGDATEVRGFAASLAYSALPEWDLESGTWGFYPTFMFVSYPVFFSLAALGDTEAAVRLPAFLFLGITLLGLADLAGRGRTRRAGGALNVLLPTLVLGYLALQVGAYYAGYHPFHGDLGCSPLEEWIVTALSIATIVLLRDGAPGIAAIASLLAILAFPSGVFLIGLTGIGALLTGSWEQRKVVLRWGTALAALFVVYLGLLIIYTVETGTFAAMMGEWYEKYFRGRASFGAESPGRMLRTIGWFALLAGGLPVLSLAIAPWRADRDARWMTFITGAYAAFFVLSPNKNIHYFFPVALLPLCIALRLATGWTERPRLAEAATGLMAFSILVVIILSFPRPVPPYVADREFGARTTFLARNERQSVEYARVLYNRFEPLWRWKRGRPWTIGPHTWVLYSSMTETPAADDDFYVGPGPAPFEGLTDVARIVLADGERVTFWSRGGLETLNDWRHREYPLRRDLSRWNFDLSPGADDE
jgi:hypothetical protein